MSAHVSRDVDDYQYQRQAPEDLFMVDDDFSAIVKTIVDLQSGDTVASSNSQLQSGSQAVLNGLLRGNHLKALYIATLRRSKACVDALIDDAVDYDPYSSVLLRYYALLLLSLSSTYQIYVPCTTYVLEQQRVKTTYLFWIFVNSPQFFVSGFFLPFDLFPICVTPS